jgi:hypothetical protein
MASLFDGRKMSLDLPSPLQRWRLLLGEPTEAVCGGLSGNALAADAALA